MVNDGDCGPTYFLLWSCTLAISVESFATPPLTCQSARVSSRQRGARNARRRIDGEAKSATG